ATVRLAVWRRFAEMPVPDSARRALDRALAALASPLGDERVAAASAVLAAATPGDAERMAAMAQKLLRNRRALAEWVMALAGAVVQTRRRLAPVVRATLDVLEPDALTVHWQLALSGAAFGPTGLGTALERLTGDALHADAVGAAERAILACALPERDQLEALEATLAASRDARRRRLALTALRVQSTDGRGWDAE